jgi:hypothetical protein
MSTAQPADFSTPPREVPAFVLYLLGLPIDASRDEIVTAWTSQVVPLMNDGPKVLFDREGNQLMAAGITGIQAQRIFRKTARGAQLLNAADRDLKARMRRSQFKGTPFQQ